MDKIKRILCALMVLGVAIGLGGCAESRQVENQAYILVMGMDLDEDRNIVISALSPKISGGSSGESGSSGGSGSEYLRLSVRGASYEEALERLNWAVPRTLNLTQLKMIVFSRDLVERANCGDLFKEIAKTELLFTAAHVVVSAGNAQEFIEAMEPTVGTRLSTDIAASIQHYVRYGIAPDSRLANLYYRTESVYSDPMAIYAVLSEEKAPSGGGGGEGGAQPASALAGPMEEVSKALDSDIRTRYLGAAVFSDGAYRGLLDGGETVLANLLSGSLDLFWYSLEGECIKLNTVGAAKVKVDTDADPARIEVSARLSVSNQDRPLDVEVLRASLRRDLEALIAHAQDMGAEPFGFAEVAARNFATLEQWQDYDWKREFQRAEVQIKLQFEQLNT